MRWEKEKGDEIHLYKMNEIWGGYGMRRYEVSIEHEMIRIWGGYKCEVRWCAWLGWGNIRWHIYEIGEDEWWDEVTWIWYECKMRKHEYEMNVKWDNMNMRRNEIR